MRSAAKLMYFFFRVFIVVLCCCSKCVVYKYSYDEKLRNQYQRYAPCELAMLRLVVPHFHSQECTEASAKRCPPEQGCFLYPPLRVFGFPFVQTVQEERHDIDCRKVNKDYVNPISDHNA